MPRYVVLYHEMPSASPRASHWDFMLEQAQGLRTWALDSQPQEGVDIAAEALADHRREYLTYEGPVSRNRGNVKQWDTGEYELLAETEHELRCAVRGQELQGVVALTRASSDNQRWMFRFRNK